MHGLSHQLFRYFLAALFSIPVAFFLAADVALGFGEKDLPYDDQLIEISFFVSWVAMAYRASRAQTLGGVLRRNASGFSMAAFLFPVAGLIFLLTEEPASDPIFPAGLIFSVTLVIGCPVGVLFWFLGRLGLEGQRELAPGPEEPQPFSARIESDDNS